MLDYVRNPSRGNSARAGVALNLHTSRPVHLQALLVCGTHLCHLWLALGAAVTASGLWSCGLFGCHPELGTRLLDPGLSGGHPGTASLRKLILRALPFLESVLFGRQPGTADLLKLIRRALPGLLRCHRTCIIHLTALCGEYQDWLHGKGGGTHPSPNIGFV